MAVSTTGVASSYGLATVTGLNGAGAATIAGWLYRSSTGVSVGFGGCAGAVAAANDRFIVLWFSDGNIYTECAQTGVVAGSVAQGGTGWHHAALVFDGSLTGNANRCKLYWDGVLKTLSITGTVGTALGSVSPFMVGRDANNRYSAGSYAEMAAWAGAALTAAQVAELAAGVVPPAVLKPTAYWPLVGRDNPEIDPVGGLDMTMVGASQAEHPRVYRRRGNRSIFVGATGGGGGFKPYWAINRSSILGSGVR